MVTFGQEKRIFHEVKDFVARNGDAPLPQELLFRMRSSIMPCCLDRSTLSGRPIIELHHQRYCENHLQSMNTIKDGFCSSDLPDALLVL